MITSPGTKFGETSDFQHGALEDLHPDPQAIVGPILGTSHPLREVPDPFCQTCSCTTTQNKVKEESEKMSEGIFFLDFSFFLGGGEGCWWP